VRPIVRLLAILAALLCASAFASSEVYKAKCALCHDSGATGAPRVGLPADWRKRADKGYAGLLRSALQGVPGTAMLPKAGFPELGDEEVAGAVQYMLSTVNLTKDLPAAAPAPAASEAAATSVRVDDLTLALSVADALVRAKIGGVQIEARDGRVTLKGMVDDAAAAARALKAARAVAGVREIENRLVSAEIFEHD
jgi:cytochrome c5